ncbi:MAG: ABC transporter substrate-binding protein [Nodosilinea sp.]
MHILRPYLKQLFLVSLVFSLIACGQFLPQPSPPTAEVQTSEQLSESSKSACRSIQHALGETCVPAQPQRIATLSDVDLVSVIALGLQPIATVFYTSPNDVPAYLQGKVNGVQVLGTHDQPNIERMLKFKPDLIIGLSYSVEPIYSLLSRIAPTIAGEWQGTSSWRDHFNFVAKVLDKPAEVQQVWDHYDQRIQALKVALKMDATHPDHLPLKISVFHICCGSLHVDTKNSFNGSILADVGFQRPASQDMVAEGGLRFISEEFIPEIDADVLFIPTDNQDQDSNQKLAELKQSPLWQQLKVVQRGRVYAVDYHIWRGANVYAADGVIDDLFKYLVDDAQPA